jgi:GNAT superfamily N-acetyltransferase
MNKPLPSQHSNVVLISPQSAAEFEALRNLLKEYTDSIAAVAYFENFEAELRDLPGDYAAPRGHLLLASVDGEWAGCCALRPLDNADYPNACEMKRLFVQPRCRAKGAGRLLAQAMLDYAHLQDYSCVLLDTLSDMETARALYQELGFAEIPPYHFNPIAGAHYLKADL